MVRRSLLLPASKPHPGAENPRGAAELRLGEPESAEREGGCLVGDSVGVVLVLADRKRRRLLGERIDLFVDFLRCRHGQTRLGLSRGFLEDSANEGHNVYYR